MFNVTHYLIEKHVKSFLLRAYGWKRRVSKSNRRLVIEFKDPESGLWYVREPAMQLLRARLKDSI